MKHQSPLSKLKKMSDSKRKPYDRPVTSKDSRKTSPKKRTCQRWTDEENDRLLKAYYKHHGKNWNAIAKDVMTKSSDSCNQHWHRVLDPSISKQPWTVHEDNVLLQKVDEYGTGHWKKTSNAIKGRTDLQCRHRWRRLTRMLKERKDEHDSEVSDQGVSSQDSDTEWCPGNVEKNRLEDIELSNVCFHESNEDHFFQETNQEQNKFFQETNQDNCIYIQQSEQRNGSFQEKNQSNEFQVMDKCQPGIQNNEQSAQQLSVDEMFTFHDLEDVDYTFELILNSPLYIDSNMSLIPYL